MEFEGVVRGSQDYCRRVEGVRRFLKNETGLPSRVISILLGLNCSSVEEIMKLEKAEVLSREGVGPRTWEEIEEFQQKFGKEMLEEQYITVGQLKEMLNLYNENDLVLINGNPGVEMVETFGINHENNMIPFVCINSYAFRSPKFSCLGTMICGRCQKIKEYPRIKKDRTWLRDAISRRLAKKAAGDSSKHPTDWSKADWRLSDAALADEYGVSKQRVHQVRQRFHRR